MGTTRGYQRRVEFGGSAGADRGGVGPAGGHVLLLGRPQQPAGLLVGQDQLHGSLLGSGTDSRAIGWPRDRVERFESRGNRIGARMNRSRGGQGNTGGRKR